MRRTLEWNGRREVTNWVVARLCGKNCKLLYPLTIVSNSTENNATIVPLFFNLMFGYKCCNETTTSSCKITNVSGIVKRVCGDVSACGVSLSLSFESKLVVSVTVNSMSLSLSWSNVGESEWTAACLWDILNDEAIIHREKDWIGIPPKDDSSHYSSSSRKEDRLGFIADGWRAMFLGFKSLGGRGVWFEWRLLAGRFRIQPAPHTS